MSDCLYLHEQTHRLLTTTLKIHKPSWFFPFIFLGPLHPFQNLCL